MTAVAAIQRWLNNTIKNDAEVKKLSDALGNRKPVKVAASPVPAAVADLPLIRFDYMGGQMQSTRCGDVYAGQLRYQIKVVADEPVTVIDPIAERIETILLTATNASEGGWAWDISMEAPVRQSETRGNQVWQHLGAIWVFDVRRGSN